MLSGMKIVFICIKSKQHPIRIRTGKGIAGVAGYYTSKMLLARMNHSDSNSEKSIISELKYSVSSLGFNQPLVR